MEQDILDMTEAVRKRCPVCGEAMHEGELYGLQCWICQDEDCGYFEPVE